MYTCMVSDEGGTAYGEVTVQLIVLGRCQVCPLGIVASLNAGWALPSPGAHRRCHALSTDSVAGRPAWRLGSRSRQPLCLQEPSLPLWSAPSLLSSTTIQTHGHHPLLRHHWEPGGADLFGA